jgi:hypothetical protein
LDTKPDVVINAVILALGKQRQGDQEFKASPNYIVIGYVSKTTTTKTSTRRRQRGKSTTGSGAHL